MVPYHHLHSVDANKSLQLPRKHTKLSARYKNSVRLLNHIPNSSQMPNVFGHSHARRISHLPNVSSTFAIS